MPICLRRLAFVVAAPLVIVGCESPSGSAVGAPASLQVIGGNNQSAVVATELPDPLVARLMDAEGHAVPGQIVNFKVTAGGGSVYAGVSISDDSGIVQERWTLGTSTADSQRLEARAVDNRTGEPLVFGVFSATALPGPPSSLYNPLDSAFAGTLGTPLADSLVAILADEYGNPIPGDTVVWTVIAGGGAVSPARSVTTVSGAKTAWTLGPCLSCSERVTAGRSGMASLMYKAEAGLPASATVSSTAGDNQTGTVGSALPESLVVTVRLANGQPVQGASVDWKDWSGGTIAPVVDSTDASGQARARWTMPTKKGMAIATASVQGIAPDSFTAAAAPGPATQVLKVQGDRQAAFASDQLPDTLAVLVEDQYGNTLAAGTAVDWAVTAGGGVVTPVAPATDADGFARALWSVGTTGPQTLTATVGGPPLVSVAFSADVGLPVKYVGIGSTSRWTCALTTGAAAYCFPGARSSAQVSGGLTFQSVTTAGWYSPALYDMCGLTVSGSAYCWFDGDLTPSPVPGGLTFDSLTMGVYQRCGLTSAGAGYCWGFNQYYTLGIDTSMDSTLDHFFDTPEPIQGGYQFASLTAGFYHTCGLTTTGAAYCWGSNFYGAIGDGTSTDRPTPVAVVGGLTFSSLSAGAYHTCGLTTGGKAYCWGSSEGYQLGFPRPDGAPNFTSPQPVSGSLTFTQISAGEFQTCAITAAGAAYCWGENAYGEVGDGSFSVRQTPVAIGEGLVFRYVVAGSRHTCGLTTDAWIYCWGSGGGMPSPDSPTPIRAPIVEAP